MSSALVPVGVAARRLRVPVAVLTYVAARAGVALLPTPGADPEVRESDLPALAPLVRAHAGALGALAELDGELGLGARRALLLLAEWHGTGTIPEVADALGVDATTALRSLSALAEHALAVTDRAGRIPGERAREWHLTEAGTAAAHAALAGSWPGAGTPSVPGVDYWGRAMTG